MREARVTRTVTINNVTALCLDHKNGNAVLTKEMQIAGDYTDKNLLKKAKEIGSVVKDDEVVIEVVAIQNNAKTERIYAMSEQDFIAHAVILEKR